MAGVEADLAEVGGVDVGEQQVRVGELGMFARAASTSRVEVGDQLVALVRQADRGGVQADHVLVGGAPRHIRIGDDGRDLGQGVVLLLREAGVGREDDVRRGVGDGLEVDAVGLVEEDRGFGAELVERVLDPGQHAVAVVVAPGRLAHADGDDSESERNLVVRPGDGRDALGLRLDRRLAVRVLDGDREGSGGGVGGRPVGAVGRAGARTSDE